MKTVAMQAKTTNIMKGYDMNKVRKMENQTAIMPYPTPTPPPRSENQRSQDRQESQNQEKHDTKNVKPKDWYTKPSYTTTPQR
jgi:hypothetical protein